MRTSATIICLLLTLAPSWAAGPTLARLSFWLAPERMDEFATAYQEKLLPILKGHGLVESAQPDRASADSVFSRLFEFESPSEFVRIRTELQFDQDSTWAAVTKNHAVLTPRGTGGARYRLDSYTTPAGVGKTVRAGPGRVVPDVRGRGHIRVYDMSDGLAGLHAPAEYDGEWRCDLHPRLSPDGTKVTVDSAHAGSGRQIYLVDIGDLIT